MVLASGLQEIAAGMKALEGMLKPQCSALTTLTIVHDK